MTRATLRMFICLIIAGAALCCGVSAGAQSSSTGGQSHPNIKSDLKSILSQPEFQPESTQPGALAQTIEKIRSQLASIWDRITAFFRRLFGGGRGLSAGYVSVYFVYVLIGIMALAAARALYRVIAARGGSNRKPTTVNTVTAQKIEEEPQLAPDEWIAQADRLARDHDYRGAFRAVFLAILVQLDKAGKIEYEKSRTNGDYLRLLRKGSLRALYELFAPLAREFDQHWYGARPSHESDYRRCLDAYHRLPTVIASTVPPTAAAGTGDAPALPAQGG